MEMSLDGIGRVGKNGSLMISALGNWTSEGCLELCRRAPKQKPLVLDPLFRGWIPVKRQPLGSLSKSENTLAPVSLLLL